ncbi:TIGR02679 family protein [Actinomadura sp. WMMB 499]|uniref:TIGR02679 family protein n=1 Tax=Actinomadura sp. WMMB 499 TaxID=1219491 RepID=UPI0012476DBF|nr:TIGR02679 family protein [Actinomadura sp. WMMB 499]QFG26272.1 TIGR02679 family protein [Actinomadura sp. WMMB 499]
MEASVDLRRLRSTLGDPALARLVAALARRIELGRPLTGPLVLARPSDAELRAIRGLLGSRRAGGGSVTVPLDRVAAALAEAAIAPDLRSAVEALTGPVTPRAVTSAAEDAARRTAGDVLAAGRHAGTDWYRAWSEAVAVDGTLTRLIRRGETRLIDAAVAVLDLLPAPGTPLPVVAERATGDTKALSGTPLAALIARALTFRAGVDQPRGAEAERDLWESAGVIIDDLSSHVLVLGLAAHGDEPLAEWLTQAAVRHTPFRITLHQLVTMPVTPSAATVHVCENPSVLRAAVSAPAAAPLICTEGIPSAACNRLLTAVADAGAAVRWRGDFDWTGLRTTATAIGRYGAEPWRMSITDYETALAAGDTEPLRGTPASSPWEPALADRMRNAGRAVMEERLIPLLLTDLTAARPPAASPATTERM